MNKHLIIEIGTNSIKSLQAEFISENWKVIAEAVYPVRLGEKLTETGRLSDTAMLRNFDTIENILKEKNSNLDYNVYILATESLRKAGNADVFIKTVEAKTGYGIEILSEQMEAEYAFYGAISKKIAADEQIAVIDIGGGSTELTIGEGEKIVFSRSFPIGAVKLTEFCFQNNPVQIGEISMIRGLLEKHIYEIMTGNRINTLIGVGGTVTTLAALSLTDKLGSISQIDGLILPLKTIQSMIELLTVKTTAEKANMTNMPPGRADIILAGSMILDMVMQRLKIEEIMVSTKGVRYGYLFSLIK